MESYKDQARAGLRAGAEACMETRSGFWWDTNILPSSSAFKEADYMVGGSLAIEDVRCSPEDAATFLLLVAEALE